MKLKFTKMHGLGNDFVVINNISNTYSLTSDHIKQLADRHCSIGFDQLLLIELPTNTEADFLYRIFNADGSQAQQCGNGVRCVARFVLEHGLTDKHQLVMQSLAGLMKVDVIDFDHITVDMGQPCLEPKQIPFYREQRENQYTLHLFETDQTIMALSMGNPHAVVMVDDITCAPLDTIGVRIAKHSDFPEGVNVGFMQVCDQSHVKLRVLERGAGETLACGSGACAAVTSGIINGMLEHTVDVALKGGHLKISWQGEGHPVFMSGPAVKVFEGMIEL